MTQLSKELTDKYFSLEQRLITIGARPPVIEFVHKLIADKTSEKLQEITALREQLAAQTADIVMLTEENERLKADLADLQQRCAHNEIIFRDTLIEANGYRNRLLKLGSEPDHD